MDLGTFTEGQRESVEHLDGPLLVSAGAGSGKTFTLTQRIAYALLPESGPFVSDIDQVMAITFTEKAAEEIKARVKRTLVSEGLHEQALRVDGAWISTIHGACARILRAHALELGIDPGFSILSEAQRAAMVQDAIGEAVDGARADSSLLGYGRLFREYDVRSAGPASPSVRSMLEELLGKASGMVGGFDSIEFGPDPAPCGTLARNLAEAYRVLAAALSEVKPSAASEKAAGEVEGSLQALEGFLDANPARDDYEMLAAVLDRCRDVPRTFGSKDFKQLVADFQSVLYETCEQAVLGVARPCADQLVRLAREVRAGYERRKLEAGALDNDDLLTKTLGAFVDFPSVAADYRDRFGLVMVDEFQDTSQLQVDLISFLAGEHLERLCTVGDSQQSIYRFRGADVNVYESHKQAMVGLGERALYVELAKNFRSHRDVLSFVDRIFEQKRSFGSGFMSLEPNLGRRTALPEGLPRIQVDLCTYERGEGLGSADAIEASAKLLAQRFAAYRDAGCSPSSMVVLLGRMANAGVFASALRAAGFECVVAGGSSFGSSPEALVVAQLLRFLANPLDTQALFQILSSDMFGLSSQDLLLLATEGYGSPHPRPRPLSAGLAEAAAGSEGGESASELALKAASLLGKARRRVVRESAATVAEEVVAASGWLMRLERQGARGRACEANVLKALRLASALERDRKAGPTTLAKEFEAELAASKEAPGALSGASSEAVRIMTIHSSKGLEFPIVGVGEFVKDARAGVLVAESVGRRVHVSLRPSRSRDRWENLFKLAAKLKGGDGELEVAWGSDGRLVGPCSAVGYRKALEKRVQDEELAEGRRKLYVALTRASEALVVELAAPASKNGSYKELVDDFRCALFGDGDFPAGEARCDIGAEQPCLFHRFDAAEVLAPDPSVAVDGKGAGTRPPFAIVQEPLCPVGPLKAWDGLRRDSVSYTSLSRGGAEKLKLGRAVLHPGGEGGPLFDLDGIFDRSHFAPDGAAGGPWRFDGEKATDFGVAFHRVAELFGKTGCVPEPSAIDAAASSAGLGSDGRRRLAAAAGRWFGSELFRKISCGGSLRAEVPFMVPLATGGRIVYLEGEMDLLRSDGGRHALVVDYKTGGSCDSSDDELRAKHALQARCYAYGLLEAGFESVELRFVYVEQDDGFGQPRNVAMRFDSADREPLGRLLGETIAESEV